MRIDGYEFMEDRLYSKNHLWIKIDNNKARIGIDSFLVSKLTGVLNIELTFVDEELEEGDPIATVYTDTNESFEIYSPLSGIVVNINENVEYDPDLIFKDNFNDGWLIELNLSNKYEIKKLLSGEEAEDWLKEEIVRDQS